MKAGIGAEERLFRKSDKPSEDLSCNWHYKKSPTYDDFASVAAAGKWCIFVSPADGTRNGEKSETLSRTTS